MTPFHLLAFAVSFAMVGVCTAAALQAGSNPLTVVTWRTLVSALLVLAWLRLAGLPLALPPRDLARAVLIALPFGANNYLLNAAFGEIPVPLAVLVFYLWPAMTAAASWALGREPVRWRTGAGLAAAFVGVALALNVELSAAQTRGVAYAVGASVTWSIAYLLTAHFFRGRDTASPTFYIMLTALAAFVAACVLTQRVALPAGAGGWAGMAGVGFFYAFALIGLFAASARLGPARAGFYMNFEPVAAVLLAALILGQHLAPIQLAGAALVVAALFLFRPPPASTRL